MPFQLGLDGSGVSMMPSPIEPPSCEKRDCEPQKAAAHEALFVDPPPGISAWAKEEDSREIEAAGWNATCH